MREQPPAPAAGPTAALTEELRALVLDQMRSRLEGMFAGADNLLMGMAERARGNDEQRRCFDTIHLVRKHRQALTRGFLEHCTAAFEPGSDVAPTAVEGPDVSFEELRMCKTRSIEESIAVNNIAVKAAGANEHVLWEIDRRLDWMIQERSAPIARTALAPATLCNAFRLGTQSLSVDFQIELLIYKLFDKLVVAGLDEMYAAALKALERGGVTGKVLKNYQRPARSGSRGGASGADAASPRTGTTGSHALPEHSDAIGASTMAGVAEAAGLARTGTGPVIPAASLATGQMPVLDPRTLEALRSAQGVAAGTASYGDAELATELAQVAGGHSVPGWGLPQARANVQSAELVGRMFNGILEDPSVPDSLKPKLDALRFAVIKQALADREFFGNPEHPVRQLVNELATLAAGVRTTGSGSIDQLVSLMEMIQAQLRVEAGAVKAAAAKAVLLAERDAERFLDDQLVQRKARRQALIDRARKVVNEEIRLRLLGRRIPDPAKPVLTSGLAPLLGLRLLRQGVESDAWREGIGLLDELVEALDPRGGTTPDPAAHKPLCARVENELLAAGMVAARVSEFLAGLRQGLDAARERGAQPGPAQAAAEGGPAPAPAEPPTALLKRLLVPGEWFKVHDAERGQKRWLKVVGEFLDDPRPDHRGRVAFAEFSGQNTLLVAVDDLLEHIAAGQTEPFDQSPGARATLADLIRQQKAFAAAGKAAG